MERKPSRLTERAFDVVIVGGGVTGAALAWDAALRGLSVALLEKGDFGEATSAASSKLIHGGIRYLQQGQLGKVRESLEERRRFLRVAPHLLTPVPFLVPTYGHGLKGKEILALGMSVYEALGAGLARDLPGARRLDRFRLLSRDDVLSREPIVRAEGLTGAAVFPEIHMHSSERMTLALVQAAVAAGAEAANYVQATGFLGEPDRVTGVRAHDLLSDEEFEVRGRLVLNAAGPWAYRFLERAGRVRPPGTMQHSKGCHVVLPSLTNGHALALATRLENEALLNRGGRHIFLIPWRGHTLVGTTNVPFRGEPDDVSVTDRDVDDFLAEIRSAIPGADLRRDRVVFAFSGLYPLVDTEVREKVYQGSGEYRVVDHREADRVDGLVTVLGAKFTTALRLAEKTIDGVFARDGRRAPPCRTGDVPVPGGDVESRAAAAAAIAKAAPALAADEVEELAATHGGLGVDIARRIGDDAALARRIGPERPVVRAAVQVAAESEMAMRLADLVFRRTGLGTLGHPGAACLADCAAILGGVHGWTAERREREIREVEATLGHAR
ncbi:MAG: glycerol-3-phosphate dehydrogenase/oxidase [Gemmatimonadetes bacterium]|nr:glycerol-3-phosphate dehydrogenase/oxidase [Gemmatimonadota bacterium]